MRVDTLRKIRKKIRSGALREFYHEALWVWGYIRRYRLAVGIYILLGLLSTLMGLGHLGCLQVSDRCGDRL